MKSIPTCACAAAMAAVLAGCSASSPVPENHVMNASFSSREAAHIHAVGNAAVNGVLSVPDRYDDSRTIMPNAEVRLFPDTAFARERMAVLFGDGKVSFDPVTISADDRRYQSYSRVGWTDDQGRFTIEDVPGGTYFLVGYGIFGEPARVQESALVYERVTLGQGEALTVALNGA